MLNKNHGLVLLSFICLLLSGVAQAAGANDPINANKGDENFYNPHDSVNPNVEEYVWKERATEIPPFPEDDNLIEFEVTRPNAAFTYFIDAKSVSYEKADGIIHYTVVIKSRNGAQNVAFEGMRCTTSEYKTFAFGNGKGSFVEPRKVVWKPVTKNDYTRYRRDLYEFYFCNLHILDLSAEKIIRELKYARPQVLPSGFR